MTAFDAHLRPQDDVSAWRAAAAMIGDRPGVAIASLVAAAIILFLACLALVAGQEVRFQATRAVDGVQASVYLRPATSRAAAEALKGQLVALPFVRGAALRTKESAIVALGTTGQQGSRSNPLPDVWIVALGLGTPDDAGSLADRASEARRALAQLPDVETVDVDTDWLATLGRWQALSAAGLRVGRALLFPLVWLLLGCLFFLAGRAFAATSAKNVRGGASIIVGGLLGLGALLASAALVVAAGFGAQSTGVDWKPIALRVGPMSGAAIAGLAMSAVVVAMVTASTGRRR